MYDDDDDDQGDTDKPSIYNDDDGGLRQTLCSAWQ